MARPSTDRLAAFLAAHHVMTLATAGSPAHPGLWAAAVFYVHDGRSLYFLSSPHSRHSVNLAHDPRSAVTIQADHHDWAQITGVQAEGLTVEVSGAERDHARSLYGAKFPLVGRIGQAPAKIAEAFARVHWYRFGPERLFLIDNRIAFGHREELDCPVPGRR
jgi:hypothetical protein